MDKVFDRFVQNAEKINETWQIVEFFEDEFKRFKAAAGNYEADMLKEQEKLKAIRAEYVATQDELKNAKLELERVKEDSKNIEAVNNSNFASIENIRNDIQMKPLEKVSIVLKDGVVVKANPASSVYPQELYEQYTKSLIEVKTLRAKLNNSDLENARLKNEIKEIRSK